MSWNFDNNVECIPDELDPLYEEDSYKLTEDELKQIEDIRNRNEKMYLYVEDPRISCQFHYA